MAIHDKAPLAEDERLASTIVCTVLARAVDESSNHGRTADAILTELTAAGLIRWGSTLDAMPLPPYKPHSTVGDRLAVARAEHYAQRAERQLDPAPVHGPPSVHAMAQATGFASIAQAWAMIALVYQAPEAD